jgi:predicted ribosome quality control (RQC) complex YloA/Tae2 family protein
VSSKGRPYKTIPFEGFDILVGRSDESNDFLTFEVGEPMDLWMHVAGGTAGSHVVVRNPEKLHELPEDVVKRAAELAAWHSKARGRARVEVHVCHVKDVEKRRGAPAGQVMLRKWWRVRVRGDAPPGES